MSVSEKPRVRPLQEKREVAFVARAKTGPGARDWSACGVAFARRNGEVGYTIKLNTLPIDKNWTGGLVLVPPFVADEDIPDEV
jgi:hypothetical protein